VVADARRVERHGLRRYPDAVELNLTRPRVDRDLGSQIAGEVGGVVGSPVRLIVPSCSRLTSHVAPSSQVRPKPPADRPE